MAERTLNENMPKADKAAYNRHIENRRIEMGVLSTAIENERRRVTIQMAKNLLLAAVPIAIIATTTKLNIQELETLQKGEELDKDE